MRLHHTLTILALLATPAAALAQNDRGASVAGAVSATFLESDTDLSFSGAFGYRFGGVVGFELEATVVPTLSSPYPDDRFRILAASPAIAIFPPPFFDNEDGRMVMLTNNARIALPIGSRPLEPYFVAGGGVAHVRRTADYVYPICLACLANVVGTPLPAELTITSRDASIRGPFTYPVTSSSVELAMTLGGGLSVRITRALAVEADLRAFRLLGETDRSMGRFGVGARYRF
jgi:opacity protein-like surface antigen